MVCWFCHYGWPAPVADIYDRYIDTAGEGAMHYGPAHIVWEDENFGRQHVQWSLDHFDECRYDGTDEENEAVRQSLIALLALPDGVREPLEWRAYEDSRGGNIEDFKPSQEMRRT